MDQDFKEYHDCFFFIEICYWYSLWEVQLEKRAAAKLPVAW